MKVLKKKRLWLLLLFPLTFLISALAKRSVFFAEEVFAKRIYKAHSIVVSAITGWIPFSLAELIVVVGPVVCLVLLIRFVVHMVKDKENRFARCMQGLIDVACVAAVILFVYVIGCGVNYHRVSVADYRGITVRDSSKEELYGLCSELAEQAAELHALREVAAREVSQGVRDMLRRLGMEEVHFEIVVEACSELTPTGADKVRYMFSANARIAPQPVEKIASGGELSRVMLSLKALLATHSKLPTIIFDEIDTGVSGRIADAMGDIIRSLSLNMQVVAITHLPQGAAKGDSHFVVYKEQSRTHLSRLTSEERVEEIAKMLSGSDITAAALEQAKILLQ